MRITANGKFSRALQPTYSPVTNVECIRMFFSKVTQSSLHIFQLDVSTAYLNAKLEKKRYYIIPEKYFKDRENFYWQSEKALYGLKESARCWYELLDLRLRELCFIKCLIETTIYRLDQDGDEVFLNIYVDNILFTCQNPKNGNALFKKFKQIFDIKHTDNSEKFIGFEVKKTSRCYYLHIKNYIETKAFIYKVNNPKFVAIPHQSGVYYEPTESKIDPKYFQSIIGTLLFAARTCRLDIAWAVNRLSVFSKASGIEHLRQAKRVLKYILHSRQLALSFKRDINKTKIEVYCDASWKNVPANMASIDGHIILLNGTPIIWKTKKQYLVAQSSTEVETIGVARGVSNLKWCTNILKFLRMKTPKVTVFSDNRGAIKLLEGQTISGRSRHIDIKYFVTRF
eukprot:snap_masked-scaffold_28-processed-gene-0.18-mRNA-1 protein AED:0.65 eAED:0.65 QI:0/-1/0/1/-1/1/1/0/397